ncbi:MAG: hypothetical protein R2702_00245 [Acidimicrobiales bacterium]
MAEVEDWPDEASSEPDLAGRYEARVAQLRRVLALAVELGWRALRWWSWPTTRAWAATRSRSSPRSGRSTASGC